MAFKFADRVKEVTATSGTGDLALDGAVNGFSTFSSRLSVGDTTFYCIVLGTQWEVGLGTLTSATTLARSSILASSNADAVVSFPSGSKEVFLDCPAFLIANLLRGDMAIPYSAAQIANFLANLGLTDRQPGIGDLVWTVGGAAPSGCLKLNGVLLSRSTYAPLWAWVQGQPTALLVSDATWTGGRTGAFSSGDGSTTFRIPDYRGESIRGFDDGRGLDNGRAIGTVQAGDIGTHKHLLPMGFDNSAWYGWLQSDNTPNFGSELFTGVRRNTVSGTAQDGQPARVGYSNLQSQQTGEIRPRNVAPLACVRYK